MPPALPAGPEQPDTAPVTDAPAEAARYAVLRRIGPALRHDLVVHLQAVAMMAEVLGTRMDKGPVPANELASQLARMHRLARDAVNGSLQVSQWLAPADDDTVDLRQGIEESLTLVRSSLGFRGFQLHADLPAPGLTVSRDLLRHLLLAALLHLSDEARPPGELHVQGGAAEGMAWLQLDLVRQEGEASLLVEETGYRPLRWADVQALAGDATLERQARPASIRIRMPRAQASSPLQVAPR